MDRLPTAANTTYSTARCIPEKRMEATKLRLTNRLRPISEDLARRAESGEFSDFESEHATPKIVLVDLLKRLERHTTSLSVRHDAHMLAQEVIEGLWDDTKEEADAWLAREGN